MRKRFLHALILCMGAQAITYAQAAPLDDAHGFLSRLKLDPVADQVVFDMTGADRSKQLLETMVQAGAGTNATLEDWSNLHKALAGEAELAIQRREMTGALSALTRQQIYYRSLESDRAASLRTSEQILEIEKTDLPGLLPFGYEAVADDLRNLGRTRESLDALLEAKRLGNALGEPSAGVPQQNWFATLWLKIVEADIQLRDLEAARDETARFLAAAEASSSLLRPRALLASADVMIAEGRFTPAIDLVKQARTLANDNNPMSIVNLDIANVASAIVAATLGPLDYADAMTTAKRIQAELGDLVAVEPMVQASLLVRRRLAGDLDGVLRQLTGQLAESRAAGDKFGQIQNLEALAATYSAFNSLDSQIAALEEALDLTRAVIPLNGLPDRPAMAALYFGVLDLLGSAYIDARQPGKASVIFQEMQQEVHRLTKASVRQYAMRHFDAEIAIGRARVLELQSRRNEAKSILGSLLATPSNEMRYNRGAVLEQLARLERDAGDIGAAVGYYDQAVAQFSEQNDVNHALVDRLERAHYLLTKGSKLPDSLAKAKAGLEIATLETESLNQFQSRWRLAYEFGLIAENAGDHEGAIVRYRSAVARLEEVRSALSQQDGRRSLVDNDLVQDLNARLAALLTYSGQSEEAWQSIERAKARSFIESLGGRHEPSSTDGDLPLKQPEFIEIDRLEKEIVNVKVALAPENALSQTRSGRDPNALRTELNGLERRFALARQQASLGNTRAGQSVALGSITLSAAQKLLPPNTTLLEYAFLPDGLTAFVVTRSTVKQIHWQVEPGELGQKVKEELLPLLSGHSEEADVDAELLDVSALVIHPVLKNLLQENESLIVIPAGYLNYLPFEALKLPDGRSMIDAFNITYLPSASALQFLHARTSSYGSAFLGAIGNVSVDGAPALPGTLAEVNAIARLEPRATVVTGKDFTRDVARDALTKFDGVHFATHGDVDADAPLFSALLTSPGINNPSRLFLYEIQNLKLQARLVVLSACRTGKGRLLGGDEVAGFTRTLLLAGAETVVASLWDVSDASTPLLMEGFYRGLQAGQSPAVAMRLSILAVRKKFPHPSYWAAFVVTGI